MKQHVWYTLFGFLFLAAAVFADEVKITGLSREAVVKNEPSRAVMGYLNTSYPDIFRNARTVCLPRGSAFEPGRGFSFQIDRECDIYLIVHRRGKPDLPGWTLTPIKTYWGIGATIANEEDVYKKHFKAGRVDIPPHNGRVGKLYGMPHAAVIPCSRKVEPLFRWNWQELGDSSATSLGPNAKQVRILPVARRSVTLRIPPEKIAGDKVFHLRFFARAKKNEVCSVQSKRLRFPFGGEYGIADIWTAIDIPFFLPENRSGATLKLDFSGTDEILLEEAALYRDTTGIKPVADQVKKFFPGNEWKAAFMGRLQPRFLPIAPGSPLDFSRQVQWVPAGSKGRIIANPNGKAAFEKEPETPVRFRCATMQVSTVRPTSKKEIDQIIADCVRQGYNMIRIMHIPGKAKYQRSGVTIDRAKFIPQNQQEFREYFDEDRLRLLDYLLAEAGKRGIYCFWYLMSSFCGWTDATAAAHWVGRNLQGQQFHAQLYVNPAFRRNWKEGVTYLMNRTNSVNGKKWKDDPVFACVLFMNEQDFRTSPVFLAAFQPEWEKEFGSGAPKLTERLLKSSSATGRKAGKFMQKKAEEMIRFYLKSVREAGYPGLVSHSNLYMRMIDAPGRELLSAADLHTYHGHPGMPLPAGSVPGYPVAAWGKQEIAVCNSSSIREQGDYLARILVKRKLNYPSFILEFADTAPNPFRHENGLFFCGYAAFNGIDGLGPHASLLPLPFSPINPYDYASFNDPIFRASDAVSAFAFQRGDVAESAHSIEFAVTPKILDSPNRMDALATEYSALFPLAKVGTRYTGLAAPEQADRPQPSLSLEPAFFSRAYGASVEAVATANEALRPQLYSRLLALLRKKEILSADNRSRADASLLESDNKQLLLNIPQGTMQVSTPRLEGAVIKQNKPVTINRLHISECTVPAAVTMISLKESQTLENADRLLLIFATNAVNFGMVTNREGTRLLETGQAPLLIHTGKLSFSLKNRQAKAPTAYALHLNGSRAESIPVRQDSDGLHVELDTARLQYGTVFFEIEYRQK